jgi:hypothetical protein
VLKRRALVIFRKHLYGPSAPRSSGPGSASGGRAGLPQSEATWRRLSEHYFRQPGISGATATSITQKTRIDQALRGQRIPNRCAAWVGHVLGSPYILNRPFDTKPASKCSVSGWYRRQVVTGCGERLAPWFNRACDVRDREFADSLTRKKLQMKSHLHNVYQCNCMTRLDRTAGRISMRFEIPAAGILSRARDFDFPNYSKACHESLGRVASEESIEILDWSIELDWEQQVVVHSVCARGITEILPWHITRALIPSEGYWQLDLLEHAIRMGWPLGPFLRTQVESQRLKRHDRKGKSLATPIPEQLLKRALTETSWRFLISPCDLPWAYISATTNRMYARQYEEKSIFKNHGKPMIRSGHTSECRQVTNSTLKIFRACVE